MSAEQHHSMLAVKRGPVVYGNVLYLSGVARRAARSTTSN